MGRLIKMSFIIKDEDKDIKLLKELREVQGEIKELNTLLKLPVLDDCNALYYNNSDSRSRIFNWINKIIDGDEDPVNLDAINLSFSTMNHVRSNGGNAIAGDGYINSAIELYKVLSKYFNDLAIYCEDRNERSKKHKKLLKREAEIKQSLNIS